jgi:6-phosphogluconolactonase (cycloisomerase 2 family)
MRMKFNKSRQLLLVSAFSLLAAGLIAACGTDTTDFVFVASARAAGSNNYGEIDVFEINSVSGAMRQIPTSPFLSEGRNPVAEAVSSDYQNLYVINQDDNTLVQFLIGSDGKIYPQNTVNTPGVYPLAVAVNGSNLFVLDTYQPLENCSNAQPCSGSVGVYPLSAAVTSGSNQTAGGAPGPNPVANGSLTYWPLCLSGYATGSTTQCKVSGSASNDIIVPTAVNVLKSGAYVYVTAFDWTAGGGAAAAGNYNNNGSVGVCSLKASTFYGANGYIFGFSVSTAGVLAPLNNGVPVHAGTLPCAAASDNDNGYLYVVDSTNNRVLSYQVGSTGALTAGGTSYATGNQPSAIAVDPSYPYAYVANAVDGNVNAYSVSSGAFTPIATYTAGIQPMAIAVDPSTHHFVFTVNFLGGNVSNFQMSTTDGTLLNTQHSPYTSNAQPTAVAAIPHNRTQK